MPPRNGTAEARSDIARALERVRLMQEYPGGFGAYMSLASAERPPEVEAIIQGTNARYPSFSATDPKWINDQLSARGFTVSEGSRKGEVYATYGGKRLQQVPETLAHEGYHQQVLQHGNPYEQKIGRVVPQALAERMRTLQPDDKAGPYWGREATTTGTNELLANLKGYEGSLPVGTALSETPAGQALFSPSRSLFDPDAQSRKDYYYQNISYPIGGLWEGQQESNLPSSLTLTREKIANVLAGRSWRKAPDDQSIAARLWKGMVAP